MFRRASARESATLDRSASSLASSIAVASLDHSKCRCGFRLRVRRRRHPPYFTKLGRLFDQGGRGHPPVRMPRFWPERSKRPPGSRAIFPWHEAQGRNVRDPKQCRTRRDLDVRVLRCADQSGDRGLWPAAGDRGRRRPDAGIYRLTTPPPSANRCRRVSPCPAFGALPAACAPARGPPLSRVGTDRSPTVKCPPICQPVQDAMQQPEGRQQSSDRSRLWMTVSHRGHRPASKPDVRS